MILNLTRKPTLERPSLIKNRIISLFLALLMLLPLCYVTSLTGLSYSASMSAKETVCPGYSYILRVALDEAAIGFEGYLSYDTRVLTLDKVVPVNPDLQDEFHVYSETGRISITHDEPVRKMLSITFWVSEDAPIGSQTVVRFTSCKVLNADGEQTVSDVSFTFTVVDGRSADTTLKGLSVALYSGEEDFQNDAKGVNAILQPSFSSAKRSYDATVPYQYRYFRIKPTATHANASVQGVLEGQLNAGETKTITVTVTAEDGTEGTYTIDLYREEKPAVSDEPSLDVSDVTSGPDDPSEEPSDVSEIPSEPSTDEESDPSQEESEESSGELSEEISEPSTSFESSYSSVSIPNTSFGRFEPRSDSWTGIILCIAAAGGLALVALLIRILVLFRKKQK